MGLIDWRQVSVVIPAKNEAQSLPGLLRKIRNLYLNVELIVVNDGSSDDTALVAAEFADVVVSHPYSKGNGAAIKSGARRVTRDYVVFMDGDGQHDPEDIKKLFDLIKDGYELVVAARNKSDHASMGRKWANNFYNHLASWVSGRKILDLTSGFRMAATLKFREFLYLLPNGFSYPTTSTMAFLRAGYSVGFVPVKVGKREGKSHIRPIRDGVRFLLIIFKVGTLYSPLKIFAPVSAVLFAFGLIHYAINYVSYARFTNMSMLLFSSSIVVIMMGLLSEQITSLIYAGTRSEERNSGSA